MSSDEVQDNGPLVNGVGGNETKVKAVSLQRLEYSQALCITCKSLNLSAERFIIDDASSLPAKGVRNPYLPQPGPIHVSDFRLKSRSSKICLGTLESILDKSKDCPFCSLVINSIANPDGDANQYLSARGTVCSVNWEIDGREAIRSPDGRKKGRTRRIHLSWSGRKFKDSYLVFVAPMGFLRPNSDAQYVWGDEALFLGRNIDTEGGSRALIKSWLDLCCKSHGGRCKDTLVVRSQSGFGDMISQSYFGVVDVYNMQLTSLPYKRSLGDLPFYPPDEEFIVHEPYVALSHVWGKGRSYQTTLQNVMLHRNHGGLEKILADLPERHVFRDAMDIVRGLGIQYMWIDSLCIVQNSIRSWNLNARVMDLIYGNAKLTICAADGQDSSVGLRAMHTKEHDDHQYMRECVPGVRLMVSRPPEAGIEASTWDKRAWTFQERLLSKRCLIFTEGRVYFQCLSTGMSEDIVADKKGAGWSLDLVRAPFQTLRELDRRALWVYANFVPLYTSRNLTMPRDILAAFNGICNRMQETLKAPFIFGLPSSHFDLALLWGPEQALERRRPTNGDKKGRAEYNGMEFPSWSWCGWIGGKMEYKPGMVEGSLANLHEWLMKHTWIHWYIRDGHGNLRPLWDGEKAVEDTSSEKRWRGYKSRREGRGRRHNRERRNLSMVVRKGRNPSMAGMSGQELYYPREQSREEWPREPYEDEQPLKQHDQPDRRYQRPQQYEYQHEDWDESPVIIERSNHDDTYGRATREGIPSDRQCCFRQTLPENPYRVVMSEYGSEPDKEFPDQPILQFWTWHTSLHLVPSDSPGSTPKNGLCKYDIADQIGDWCGAIFLDEKWIKDSKLSRQEFIAISEAKTFTQEECDIWTYYIPKERDQSEWDLYYVLLIERRQAKWERVALGKVFKPAFANSEWREIILG
ncbi:hypothetical protein MMC28_004996 [Mycoblastus sanguinarius]|nr:hypothetical protein [Mycoblastus sanguinarius]